MLNEMSSDLDTAEEKTDREHSVMDFIKNHRGKNEDNVST